MTQFNCFKELHIEKKIRKKMEFIDYTKEEVKDETTVKVPEEATVEATVEVPEEATVKVPEEATVEATVEVPEEATVKVPEEATVEATVKVPEEATVEATVEVPEEAVIADLTSEITRLRINEKNYLFAMDTRRQVINILTKDLAESRAREKKEEPEEEEEEADEEEAEEEAEEEEAEEEEAEEINESMPGDYIGRIYINKMWRMVLYGPQLGIKMRVFAKLSDDGEPKYIMKPVTKPYQSRIDRTSAWVEPVFSSKKVEKVTKKTTKKTTKVVKR
jgi:hypothetical protein